MSRNDVIITRADHDDVNLYLFHWTEEIIEFATRKGFKVVDLKNERANKVQFTSVIQDKNPTFLLFNGHGEPNCIRGQDDEKIIILDENHALLKSRITYARSCWAVLGLGKKCEEMGSDTCFIGYASTYVMVADEHSIAKPLKDEFAQPFLESSNIIPLSILKGNTAKEALEKSEKIMKKHIDFFESHNLPGYSDVASCLKWDLDNQKCCGNSNLSL